MSVFGSVARGEQDGESDLDLLVDIDDGRSLLDLAGLIDDLLGCPVNVYDQLNIDRLWVAVEAVPHLTDQIEAILEQMI